MKIHEISRRKLISHPLTNGEKNLITHMSLGSPTIDQIIKYSKELAPMENGWYTPGEVLPTLPSVRGRFICLEGTVKSAHFALDAGTYVELQGEASDLFGRIDEIVRHAGSFVCDTLEQQQDTHNPDRGFYLDNPVCNQNSIIFRINPLTPEQNQAAKDRYEKGQKIEIPIGPPEREDRYPLIFPWVLLV